MVSIMYFTITACKSDLERFHDQATLYTQSSRTLDQKDFDALLLLISRSDDGSLRPFKRRGDTPDCRLVLEHLNGFYHGKVNIAAQCKTAPVRFNVDVFVDNSGSMNGYFKKTQQFKSTLSYLLTALQGLPEVDSLNLNCINSRPVPVITGAKPQQIDVFCDALAPARSDPNRANTDIASMLRELLDYSGTRDLSIFISDCVFSPSGVEASDYLKAQNYDIHGAFAAARRSHPDLAILLLQCVSGFDGTYYDCKNTTHKIHFDRPYYIWFIGRYPQINTVLHGSILAQLAPACRHKLVLQSLPGPISPRYKIMQNHKLGDFQLDENAGGPLTDATPSTDPSTRGKFGFEIMLDLTQSLQDEDYFLDSTLFHSDPYKTHIERIGGIPDVTTSGFSHLLRLETDNLRPGTQNIDIYGKMPSWIDSCSSDNDTGIEHVAAETRRTYGLSPLLEGVYKAFYPIRDSERIFRVSIDIKR